MFFWENLDLSVKRDKRERSRRENGGKEGGGKGR